MFMLRVFLAQPKMTTTHVGATKNFAIEIALVTDKDNVNKLIRLRSYSTTPLRTKAFVINLEIFDEEFPSFIFVIFSKNSRKRIKIN